MLLPPLRFDREVYANAAPPGLARLPECSTAYPLGNLAPRLAARRQRRAGRVRPRYGELMAAASLATIPVILAFLLFQRHIIRGISLSGLAGR